MPWEELGMGRARRGARASRTGQLLLVALGAVAGLAIGMAAADRAGGLDGLLRRRQSVRRRRRLDDGWRGDERRSQSFDELADDDSELAPEAISHLHLRSRTSAPDSGRATTGQAPAHDAGNDAGNDSDPLRRGGTGRRNDSDPEGVEAEVLELRVLEVFRNDPLLAVRNIDIGADQHGRVELTGWVEAPAEVDYAMTLARGVPQVNSVLSHLMIRKRGAS